MSNGENIGFIRSLVNGDLEGFRQGFESFLDKCPSFLYHVGRSRFLPVSFFSMFATAHNAGILHPNEEIYFRFDNHGVDPRNGEDRNTGNLKVAVLTNEFLGGKKIVRCYSICDVYNSQGARFSERERTSIEDQIADQNPGLEGNLHFEQYKVSMHGRSKSQGEAIATAFDVIRESEFGKYSSSEIDFLRQEILEDDKLTVKKIEAKQLNQNQRTQLDRLVNFTQIVSYPQGIGDFIEMLASDNEENVRDRMYEEILPYIIRTYRNYRQVLENDIENRNQKFESYGFLLGFLANLSHLCTMDIDLPENSYVAFLVRHQEERGNVPTVISIATGRTWSRTALNLARGDAERLHVSSFIPIHTESRHVVCVGLNFNLNRIPFSIDIAELQQDRFPLVQRLFECLEDDAVREDIGNVLLQHLPGEIPRNIENYNRVFDYITGFVFGNSAFIREYLELEEGGDQVRIRKYIFRYDDEDLRRHVFTMVFHAQGSNVVILHIGDHGMQQQGAINLQTLNADRNNVHVWEVSCTFNNQLELDIDPANDLGLYHDYQNNNANNFLDGDLVQVPNAENVHNTLNQVISDGWQNRDQHGELFRAISRVLMPEDMIIDVNSEDKSHSMLYGIFYASDNLDKVIARYKVGEIREFNRREELQETTEQRLDLLLLRQPTADTHPIGYVWKFANDIEEVEQKRNEAEQQITELMDRRRGYMHITRGNEVVLSYAIFNRDARRAEDLILLPDRLYVRELTRGRYTLESGRLVEPGSIIDENPPAGLLSDITRERLIDYFQSNQRSGSIPLFDLGNNRWVAVRYLEGNKERIIKTLRSSGTAHSSPTVQGILRQINNILGDGNQIPEVSDLLTLEFATQYQAYDYWLQEIDISRAGRLQYQLHTDDNHAFEVVNLARNNQQMADVLGQFMGNATQQRLTLIITLNNTHWVALVIERQNENYVGYYANSSGVAISDNIIPIIQNTLGNNIRIENVSVRQQTDGHNCGLWALENARDTNTVLQRNNNLREQSRGVLGEIRHSLTLNVPGLNNQVDPNNPRNEQYFQNLRRDISQLLRDDQQDQSIQLDAYIQNRDQIDPLLQRYLELGYHRTGGGYGLVRAPILLSDSGNPQSTLEGAEASSVSGPSKGKGGR